MNPVVEYSTPSERTKGVERPAVPITNSPTAGTSPPTEAGATGGTAPRGAQESTYLETRPLVSVGDALAQETEGTTTIQDEQVTFFIS